MSAPPTAAVSPAVRAGYVLPHRTTALAIGGSFLGVLLAASGQTILATAMPAVTEAVGSPSDYSWLFSAYLLAMAVTIPLYGRLSDIHGRRPFLAGAIILYMAGGLLGGLAGSMELLVVARTLQGVAAGGLIPLPQAVIADLVPPSDRGRWQGLYGLAVAVSSLLGPIGGGWLADHASWRWVFLAPLPLGALALVIVLATLRIPPHADRRLGVDLLGTALLTLGVGGAMVATAIGGHVAPWGSPLVVGLFAGGVAALGLFVAVERRAAHPLVPPEVLGSRTVLAASVAALALSAAFFSVLAFVPLFSQAAQGTNATEAGLVLMPMLLALTASTLFSGQVIARTGRYRWALLLGPAVSAAGCLWLATLDASSSGLAVAAGTAVGGTGIGLVMQNLLLAVQNATPAREAGVATGTTQLSRALGSTIGVTVMGAIVTASLAGGDLALSADPSAAERAQAADAVHPVFVAGIPLCLLALVAASRIPELPLRRTAREELPPPPA